MDTDRSGVNPPTAERSRTMRAVKDRNTYPELRVRRLLHSMGYRYRLHRIDLPGKPDIVFEPHFKAIFVHGCFWHGHGCKRGARKPRANAAYWEKKIAGNVERYSRQQEELRDGGWSILTIWECELDKTERLETRIRRFLENVTDIQT